jgi:hypothetical protein
VKIQSREFQLPREFQLRSRDETRVVPDAAGKWRPGLARDMGMSVGRAVLAAGRMQGNLGLPPFYAEGFRLLAPMRHSSSFSRAGDRGRPLWTSLSKEIRLFATTSLV